MRRQWLMASMTISLAAALALSSGCKSMGDKGEEAEEHETKVAFADVPAPVRATLTAQAPGAKITTVDHEMKNGKMVYEADAMMDGKNWEILVAEDGKLISKKVDDELADKGEAKDKEEKEEDEAKEKK